MRVTPPTFFANSMLFLVGAVTEKMPGMLMYKSALSVYFLFFGQITRSKMAGS